MLYHYFKAAYRSLFNALAFSSINLLGLVTGISAAVLLGIYVLFIFTYDFQHQNRADTYLVYKERITPDGIQPTYDTWVPLLPQLQSDFPQVVSGTRIGETDTRITLGNQTFEEEAQYVDPGFFEIFSFSLKRGNQQVPFPDLNSVVLSQSVALRLFGSEEPMGETIQVFDQDIGAEKSYVVTGILNDHPANTSVTPSVLMPIEGIPGYEEIENEWGSSFLSTYVLLDGPEAKKNLEVAFPAFIAKIWDEETQQRTNFRLLPLTASYETFVGDIQDAKLLLLIAIATVLIASFNYMNLSTARSIDRSKEIGVRKVLGALSGNLKMQFFYEAFIMITLATFIAIGIARLLLPFLNDSLSLMLSTSVFLTVQFWVVAALFVLVLTALSGSYPALVMSRIKTLVALKGFSKSRSGSYFRNVLVVTQFALGVMMIIGALIIRDQILFMKNSPLGFDKNNQLVIRASVADFEDEEVGNTRLNTFKDQLKSLTMVESVTASRHVPTEWSRSFTFVQPEGWEGSPLRMRYTFMDAEFFDTYNAELLEGSGFLPDENGHQRESVILNEAALKAFGWESTESKKIEIGRHKFNVVGLVRDFKFETLREEVAPTLHLHRASEHPVHGRITINAVSANPRLLVEEVEALWAQTGALKPLDFFFLDENVARMYESENRLLKLVTGFTVIALIIAGLGLFGLSSYVVSKRQKEISLRKVIGASLSELFVLITRDFAVLIFLSIMLGSAVSYYLGSSWLENFAYRHDISFMNFGLAFVSVAVLLVAAVGYKVTLAAQANPVKYLRNE